MPVRWHRLQHRLEGQHMCHIGRHWYDGHHASPRIVARSFAPSLLTIYNGPPPIGLRAAYRLKVGKANLALSHERGSASAAVGSHKSASPDFSHSCQASSYASPSWDARNNPIARWTAAERDSMLSCHGRRGSR